MQEDVFFLEVCKALDQWEKDHDFFLPVESRDDLVDNIVDSVMVVVREYFDFLEGNGKEE